MSKKITLSTTVSRDNITGKLSERTSRTITTSSSDGLSPGAVRAGRTFTSRSFGKSLLCFILLLLLLVNMFLSMQGHSDALFNFEKLFDVVANCKTISTDWISVITFHIDQSWGVFDFIRSFINQLGASIGMLAFLGTTFINLIAFIFQFSYLLFL